MANSSLWAIFGGLLLMLALYVVGTNKAQQSISKGMDVHTFGLPTARLLHRFDYSTHAPKANTCLVTNEAFSAPFPSPCIFCQSHLTRQQHNPVYAQPQLASSYRTCDTIQSLFMPGVRMSALCRKG